MDTHVHTYTQDNYSNPRCACAPRVNEEMKALLGIWGAANMQAQLNVVSCKKVVYERVGFYW